MLPSPQAVRLAVGAVLLVAVLGCPAGATEFHVGPGEAFENVNDVPWEAIAAGDVVHIHWRAAPYREKWVIVGPGTAEAPVVVRGVAGPDGQWPVIDGENATTRLALDYWNERRSVIKVGGSNVPPDDLPEHVVIENLDIRGGRLGNSFVDHAGSQRTYMANAAAIHVERGRHVTIRNCILRESSNGLFVSSSDAEAAEDILIEGNYIHSNGNVGSYFHHNTYTAAIGIVYQYNRFGPLQDGAGGNNLKDRSAGLVVRYNWIYGANRQLDLVDAEDSVLIRNHPDYHASFVYGNVLIEPPAAGNKQILHYGGDSGATDSYRKGTLHFYHNTVVSRRWDGATLARLSTNDEHCDARNNILYTVAGGGAFAMLDETGVLDLSHNWIKPGWVDTFGTLAGEIHDDGTQIETDEPGFADEAGDDFTLRLESAGVDAATSLHPAVLPEHDVVAQYVPHQAGTPRRRAGVAADVGAFETWQPFDLEADTGARRSLAELPARPQPSEPAP